MTRRANARRGPGVAVISSGKAITVKNSPHRTVRQDPPIEHHDPLADDKLALFEVPAVYRLAGTWQGPGTIAELCRRAR